MKFRRVKRGPGEHWGGLYRSEDGRYEVEDRDTALTRRVRRVPFSASWYVSDNGRILLGGLDTKREALEIFEAYLEGTPIPSWCVWEELL